MIKSLPPYVFLYPPWSQVKIVWVDVKKSRPLLNHPKFINCVPLQPWRHCDWTPLPPHSSHVACPPPQSPCPGHGAWLTARTLSPSPLSPSCWLRQKQTAPWANRATIFFCQHFWQRWSYSINTHVRKSNIYINKKTPFTEKNMPDIWIQGILLLNFQHHILVT